MLRAEREQIKMIEDAGLAVDKLEPGRHLKAYIRNAAGCTMVMQIASSPSGGRWEDNFRSKLRRFARVTSPSL
jgi:anaerobic ribonucleoside-triphosphate reductase